VQYDFLEVSDTQTSNYYEAESEVKTHEAAAGWNAELRIPFSQMRFPVQDGNRTV
jgi:hypothetical protein